MVGPYRDRLERLHYRRPKLKSSAYRGQTRCRGRAQGDRCDKGAGRLTGDESGTDALEKRLWRVAGLNPAASGDRWCRDIGGCMGAKLNAAAAMGAYTLSDRGTWLSFGHKAGMRIELEGDPRLLNRYDVILLNPKIHPQAKQAPARRFATWLASPEGQAAIGGYSIAGHQLFHPESDPKP